MTNLTQQSQAAFNNVVVFIDEELENTGTVLTTSSFDSATDRIYDIRGFLGFFSQINNAGSVSIDVLIEKATKHFDNISDLTNADFVEEVAVETVAASGLSAPYENLRATPMDTAIRIRLKLNTGSGSETIFGVISAN